MDILYIKLNRFHTVPSNKNFWLYSSSTKIGTMKPLKSEPRKS